MLFLLLLFLCFFSLVYVLQNVVTFCESWNVNAKQHPLCFIDVGQALLAIFLPTCLAGSCFTLHLHCTLQMIVLARFLVLCHTLVAYWDNGMLLYSIVISGDLIRLRFRSPHLWWVLFPFRLPYVACTLLIVCSMVFPWVLGRLSCSLSPVWLANSQFQQLLLSHCLLSDAISVFHFWQLKLNASYLLYSSFFGTGW